MYPHCYYLTQGAQKFTSIQRERVTAQVRGVNIQNCGTTGTIINAALAVLNIYADRFGVLVDCQASSGCVKVRVDAPADDPVADIDVCDLGKSLIEQEDDINVYSCCESCFFFVMQAMGKLVCRSMLNQLQPVVGLSP